MESPHAIAEAMCPACRASAVSAVATPLQPNARPAPTMVTIAGERPTALSR